MLRTTMLVAILSFWTGSALAQLQEPSQQLLENFERIDVNGDGFMSSVEFLDAQSVRWAQIDRNADGYLSKDDFPRIVARRARRQLAEIADLDANGDGLISQSEFIDGLAPVFHRADRNADGALTRSELGEATP